MKINRKQVDQIREMTTDQLIKVASSWVRPNTDEFLFVECAKYELKARKANAQCGCDDCYEADGWQICA
jgi:hypothetical protein